MDRINKQKLRDLNNLFKTMIIKFLKTFLMIYYKTNSNYTQQTIRKANLFKNVTI